MSRVLRFAGPLLLLAVAAAPLRAQQPTLEAELDRLATQLTHPLDHKRLEAIEALGALGANGRVAAPRLLFILEHDPLIAARVAAARSLPRLGASRTITAALVKALQNRENHYELRREAARGLGSIAVGVPPQAAEPIVAVLLGELESKEHGNLVEVALAESVGRLGPVARMGQARLEHMLETSNFEDVQVASFLALARVVPADPQASVTNLVAELNDERAAAKAVALGRLRALGPAASEAVPALVSLTTSDHPIYERAAALEVLARVAPADATALRCFVDALGTRNYLLEPRGEAGLRALQPAHAEAAIGPLLGFLEQPGAADLVVFETLTRIAPRDPKTVAVVVQRLASFDADSDEMLAHTVLDAVRAGGDAATGALEHLATLIQPSSALYEGRPAVTVGYLIGHALVALAEVGVPAESIPLVFAELERDDPYSRPAAIRAVGSLGAAGAPAVPRLIEYLNTPPWSPALPFLHEATPTLESIRALGRIGVAAKAAIPALERYSGRATRGLAQTQVLETQAARAALRSIRG